MSATSRGPAHQASSRGGEGKKGEPRRPVSRVLYPAVPRRERRDRGAVTIYLARPRAAGAVGLPRSAGRRYHRGRAANPGTGRAPIVPLFGLAPGGVWPSLCHHRRPDALTVRFHPYPDKSGRYVSVPLSVPCGSVAAAEAWALPSTLPSGARTFLPGAPIDWAAAAVTRSTWPSTCTLA